MILESGVVPESWSIGVITAIYKNKGSKDNPDNYRGITLLSCISKLFTSLVNYRLTLYLDAYSLLGEEQTGFREGYSTIDNIFVLYSLIDLCLSKRKRIYAAFVDYKKAFDTVDRSALWQKLINIGFNGKLFNVIKNIYDNAKSCVRSNGQMSDFFNSEIGVR